MTNIAFTHTITKGDTLLPLGVLFRVNGKPYDLSDKTVTVVIEKANGDAEQAETATGVTAHPTHTFTVDTTNDYIVSNDHRVKLGDQIVVSNSGGALPTGLATSTRYFARDVEDNAFKVSLTRTGTPVDISGAGTGTQSYYLVGSAEYDFSSGNTDTGGRYHLWFVATKAAERQTFPPDGAKILVDVVDNGY